MAVLDGWVKSSRGQDPYGALCWELRRDPDIARVRALAAEDREGTAEPLALAAWALGDPGLAQTLVDRLTRGAPPDDPRWWRAAALFPDRPNDGNRTVQWKLAAAEGKLVAGEVEGAGALVRSAIEGHLVPSSSPFGIDVGGDRAATRIAQALAALGADETAWEFVDLATAPGPLALAAAATTVAAALVAAGPSRHRAAAKETVLAALASLTALDPTLGAHRCEACLGAILPLGAKDLARELVLALCRPPAAKDPMWRAVRAASTAVCCYRSGLVARGDELLEEAIDVDGTFRKKRVRSGPNVTVGLSVVRALVSAGRFRELPKALERIDLQPGALGDACRAAASHPEGEVLLAWAHELPEEPRASALRSALQASVEAVAPSVHAWGCLATALLPEGKRPRPRVEGSKNLGTLPSRREPAPPSGMELLLADMRTRAHEAKRPGAGRRFLDAVRAGDDDEILDAVWMAVDVLEPRELAHHPELRHVYASRLLESDVLNGGFSQAAYNILPWFEPAAEGYEALGLPACAARIREVLPAARVENAVRQGRRAPKVKAKLPASFDAFEEDLHEIGWEADAVRARYLREHAEEVAASLDALRGPRERR